MIICRGCLKPLDQCTCTAEEKEKWVRKKESYSRFFWGDEDRPRKNYERNLRKKEELEQKLQNLRYEVEESTPVDAEIWEISQTLEAKGYHYPKVYWGYTSEGSREIYYQLDFYFEERYWFDFTEIPFKKGWSYHLRRNQLVFSADRFTEAYLKRNHITPEELTEQAKHAFLEWAKNLPEARVVSQEEPMPGLLKTGLMKMRESK